MIVIYQTTGSFQSFRVRTRECYCSGSLSARLQVGNAETYTTASYTPTTLYYDDYGFLNVEAQLDINPDTYYTLEIIQQSASVDCQTLYRGEIYLRSGSSDVIDGKPFQSYDKLETKYIIW